MKISTKGRYGLRVMIDLAAHCGHGPVSADQISKRQDISAKYIHVLVAGLRSAGLVTTVRGAEGGYQLARKPSKITALEVIVALEGPCDPVECVSNPSACPRAACCASRDLWNQVARAAQAVLGAHTLEMLARQQAEKQLEAANYHI